MKSPKLYNIKTSYMLCMLVLGLNISYCAARSGSILPPQKVKPDSTINVKSKIAETPPNVLKMFYDAGMSPTIHKLTAEELKTVELAFAVLPPVHRQVLRSHLKSISFLDNMPNTALTSILEEDKTGKYYHITFRAAILHQNISQWLTEKERTCFVNNAPSLAINVNGGVLSAFTYVLIHEGTHVVDGSLGLLTPDTTKSNTFIAAFTKGIWRDRTNLSWQVTDSLLLKNRFRKDGTPLPATKAIYIYALLKQTPFVSLYSTSSRHEDLAEYVTVYHLTQHLKQPFKITVTQNGKEITNYEPFRSALVKKRMAITKRFYQNNPLG